MVVVCVGSGSQSLQVVNVEQVFELNGAWAGNKYWLFQVTNFQDIRWPILLNTMSWVVCRRGVVQDKMGARRPSRGHFLWWQRTPQKCLGSGRGREKCVNLVIFRS